MRCLGAGAHISDAMRSVLAHDRLASTDLMRSDGVHLTLTIAPALDGGVLIMVEDSSEPSCRGRAHRAEPASMI